MADVALLGVHVYAGRRCLPTAGSVCIATGVTLRGTDLDWVGYTPATAISLPPRIVSITGATVILNGGNAPQDGYLLALAVHTLVS